MHGWLVLDPVRYSQAPQTPTPEHPVCCARTLQETGEGSSFYPEHRQASRLLRLASYLCQSARGWTQAYPPSPEKGSQRGLITQPSIKCSNGSWMLPTRCTVPKPPLYGMPVASHTVFSKVLAAAYTGFMYICVPLPKSLLPTRRRGLLSGSSVTLQMTGQITSYL